MCIGLYLNLPYDPQGKYTKKAPHKVELPKQNLTIKNL